MQMLLENYYMPAISKPRSTPSSISSAPGARPCQVAKRPGPAPEPRRRERVRRGSAAGRRQAAGIARLGCGKDEVTAHGFRATASTLLNESGRFPADAIERALAHQGPDPVRRAHARGSFWKERVEMAQWWANHLDTLRKGGEVAGGC